MKTTIPGLKTLKDYTPEQIAEFEKIQAALTSLNANYNKDAELLLLDFSQEEIGECSAYYELLTAEKFKD